MKIRYRGEDSTKKELLQTLAPHILEKTELTGRYDRKYVKNLP